MKKQILFLALVLAAAACTSKQGKNAGASGAAGAPVPLPPRFELPAADVKAGQALSAQGNSQKGLAPCLACHGPQGEGQAGGGFPRLAGQSRLYLVEQLRDYRSGVRENPVMMPIAKALSDQDMENVSAYFEQIAPLPAFLASAKLTAAERARGKQLLEVGDESMNLQSCANCHGPGGRGEAPSIPYIGGQYANYLEAQLKAWRAGTRKSNPEHMGYISKNISEKDAHTVSLYLQAVPHL